MVRTKQKHRAPKPKTIQPVYQERTSSFTLDAISLHKEDQAVEEKQSYAMVTGLLQVLVASIAYQRELFPKSCFEPRLPSSIRPKAHDSYEEADACSNTASSDDEVALFANALAQRDQPLMVLASGKTGGVDKLLAWLDEIFKGLLDRSLNGVQFTIYADKSRPSKVLELYTFSFEYRNGLDGQRRLMGLTPPGCGTGMITTRTLRSDMVNVIDQLNNYQLKLPALPRERYLMCHLFHSPNTPRHHRTPGFHKCTDTTMAVIENGLWSMKQRSFGSIDSGFHRMGLEIEFMTPTDAAKEPNYRSIPAHDMEYNRTVQRTLKPDLGRCFDSQAASPGATHTTKRPRGGFTQAYEQRDSSRLGLLQDVTEKSGRSEEAMRQTMSRRPFSKYSGGSITTQGTLSANSNLPTQVEEAQGPPALLSWNYKLKFEKEIEMSVKQDHKHWIPDGDDRVVRCECSSDREDLSMLRCICCGKLQHCFCYGFASETHVHKHHCYQCLLEDTHGGLLPDMKAIAIFRRALWILYEKTPSSPAEFARELHFDAKTTQGLIKRLDEGGYLASGGTLLSPVTTPDQLSFKRSLYGNPLTSIGLFYDPAEDILPAIAEIEDGSARRKRVKI